VYELQNRAPCKQAGILGIAGHVKNACASLQMVAEADW